MPKLHVGFNSPTGPKGQRSLIAKTRIAPAAAEYKQHKENNQYGRRCFSFGKGHAGGRPKPHAREDRRFTRGSGKVSSASPAVHKASTVTRADEQEKPGLAPNREPWQASSVPAQREMQSGRSPLASIPRFGRGLSGHGVNRSDVLCWEARKRGPRAPPIVAMSPLGYPSAWLRPRRARFRFAWHGYCNHLMPPVAGAIGAAGAHPPAYGPTRPGSPSAGQPACRPA